MADDNERTEGDESPRRFRFTRKVKTPKQEPVRTYAEQEMKALEEADEAEKGSPEMHREVNRGCRSCLNVTLLILIIMVGSIITTCAVRQ